MLSGLRIVFGRMRFLELLINLTEEKGRALDVFGWRSAEEHFVLAAWYDPRAGQRIGLIRRYLLG
jgi:hypothetical protein